MSDTLTQESVRGGIRPFVEWLEQARQPSADEASEILGNAAIPVFLLEQLEKSARKMLDRGVEHGKLVRVLGDLKVMTESCIRAFAQVQMRPETPELAAHATSTLDATLKRLEEMRAAVSSMLQWLETPLPPIDLSKLPKTSAEPGAVGYISLNEMAARLRAGN